MSARRACACLGLSSRTAGSELVSAFGCEQCKCCSPKQCRTPIIHRPPQTRRVMCAQARACPARHPAALLVQASSAGRPRRQRAAAGAACRAAAACPRRPAGGARAAPRLVLDAALGQHVQAGRQHGYIFWEDRQLALLGLAREALHAHNVAAPHAARARGSPQRRRARQAWRRARRGRAPAHTGGGRGAERPNGPTCMPIAERAAALGARRGAG